MPAGTDGCLRELFLVDHSAMLAAIRPIWVSEWALEFRAKRIGLSINQNSICVDLLSGQAVAGLAILNRQVPATAGSPSRPLSMTILDIIPTAQSVLSDNARLPDGVQLRPLTTHADRRGDLTELFREEWGLGRAVQWNLVRSQANVLRGVHAHRSHIDYLTVPMGEMILGLSDLRPTSPTHRLSFMLRLQSHDLHLAVIPTGVAHGFYFPETACLLYAVSHYHQRGDEFGCRWNEAALRLDWPCHAPLLSERDGAAGSYADMISAMGLLEQR